MFNTAEDARQARRARGQGKKARRAMAARLRASYAKNTACLGRGARTARLHGQSARRVAVCPARRAAGRHAAAAARRQGALGADPCKTAAAGLIKAVLPTAVRPAGSTTLAGRSCTAARRRALPLSLATAHRPPPLPPLPPRRAVPAGSRLRPHAAPPFPPSLPSPATPAPPPSIPVLLHSFSSHPPPHCLAPTPRSRTRGRHAAAAPCERRKAAQGGAGQAASGGRGSGLGAAERADAPPGGGQCAPAPPAPPAPPARRPAHPSAAARAPRRQGEGQSRGERGGGGREGGGGSRKEWRNGRRMRCSAGPPARRRRLSI